MQTTITLQPITPQCVEAYKLVRLRALRDAPWAFGSTYAREAALSEVEWLERAAGLDGDRAIGYLALDGGDPCGIAVGFVDKIDPLMADLFSMWVAPTHRRRGVGAMLVSRIVDWARSRGVGAIRLMVTSSNDAAERFYERLGFTRTGRTEPYPNDPSMIEYEMMYEIGGVA